MYFKKSLLKHFTTIHDDSYLHLLKDIISKLELNKTFMMRFRNDVHLGVHYSSLLKRIIKETDKMNHYKPHFGEYGKYTSSIYDYLQKDTEFTPIHDRNIEIEETYPKMRFSRSINEKIINDLDDMKFHIEVLLVVGNTTPTPKEKFLKGSEIKTVGECADMYAKTVERSKKIKDLLTSMKESLDITVSMINESEGKNEDQKC